MTPKPRRQDCGLKQALIGALEAAHTRMLDLNNREVDAVMRGDADADAAIQAELRKVRRQREEAIAAIRKHVADHGC